MTKRTTIYKQQIFTRLKNHPIIMVDIRRNAKGETISVGIQRAGGKAYAEYFNQQAQRLAKVALGLCED